ncbi:universal stress protein [Nocardioides plantarum]
MPEAASSPCPAADPRVVLGYDGSTSGVEVLRWAAAQARARSCTLEVVACWPDPGELFVHEVPGHFSSPRNRAVADLEHAMEVTREDCVGVEVVTTVANAHPVDALVSRCSPCDLLVVGASDGRKPRQGLAVDQLCSLLAPCRVVVVETAGRPMRATE